MKDPATISTLEEAYRLVRNGFVRYVVDESRPEVRDAFDRRVLAAYSDWSQEGARSQAAILALLLEEDAAPEEGSYPLEYSQFHFLSPGYLLRNAIAKGGAETEELDALGRRLAGWPYAQILVESIVARQRGCLERLKALEAEQPHEPPRPARLKGTSASRW
ncbi:MAG: hypothetical protein HY721_26425 [Planctomycetes bacterium]|nr:hypothetical protein [Planctomycetota bacterium]